MGILRGTPTRIENCRDVSLGGVLCAFAGASGQRSSSICKSLFGTGRFYTALDRIGSDAGIFMIAAAGEDQEAQEVDELKHGLLTYSLLAAAGAVEHGPLRDRAVVTSNPGQVVDVLEWFNFSAGTVPRLMQRYFGRIQEVRLTGSRSAFPVLQVAGD